MLYLSIAIVICFLVYVWKEPSINIRYHKTIELIQPPMPPAPTPLTEDEIDELQKNAPPTLDQLTKALNETLHELGGDS